jgi:antitoxin (DNA-binding transcriptional repressor) of toxin-antitoxin stability system
MTATIHQAKTHLSRLIRKALDGENVIIANRDKPLVRLEPIKAGGKPGRRPLGWAKGLGFYMAEDFDAPLEDFEEYMYTDDELAERRARKSR